ncbi:MAG: CopL family metal-binding regulatory protein [Dokdonella sp.]|nr:CopL family metal-binding regulatory protein [Dokdonella sp.]
MRLISLLSRICLSGALLLNGFALPSAGAHAAMGAGQGDVATSAAESSSIAPCHESPATSADTPDHHLPGIPDPHDGNSGAGQACCSGGCNCACMTSSCAVLIASLEFALGPAFRMHTPSHEPGYFPPQLLHLTRPPIA